MARNILCRMEQTRFVLSTPGGVTIDAKLQNNVKIPCGWREEKYHVGSAFGLSCRMEVSEQEEWEVSKDGKRVSSRP